MTTEVFVGDVIALTLTAKNPDTGAVVDLSVYDSVSIVLAKPRSSTLLTLAASLPGGGSSGVATATVAQGQLDTVGTWETQIVGFKAGKAWHHSSELVFQVLPPLGS